MAEITVVVSAPIALGKTKFVETLHKRKTCSRLLPLLSKATEIKVLEESPDVIDIVKKRFIPAFEKKDPEGLFLAELDIAQIRFEQYLKVTETGGIWVLERWLGEDRFGFVEALARMKLLKEHHYEAYKKFVDPRLKSLIPPDIYVQMHSSWEVGYRRMQQRGIRWELEHYTPEYFQVLHECYKHMARYDLPELFLNFNMIYLPIDVNKHLEPEELEGFHKDIEYRIEQRLIARGFVRNDKPPEE